MRKTIATIIFSSMLLFAVQNADVAYETTAPEEITGYKPMNAETNDEASGYERTIPSTPGQQRKIQLNRLGQVLLIPESTADVVGMYDPYDGTHLGNLITNSPALLSTPINAIPGPDGNIYLSDQVSDGVFAYDTLGNYLFTYADTSDGLNNIRGIDFRNGHLFVTNAGPPPIVREFSAPHTFVRDFITDGSDPFDILFLDDGRALLADILGSTDNIRLYDTNGTFLYQLFSINFPEQVQFDEVLPGAFLNAAFSANVITDFELSGTIISTLPYSGGPRGIYRLGNGNLLATNGTGIHELDPVTGAIIQTENTGSGRFIELYTVPGGGGGPYLWDFEDGWQGWTKTGAYAFPNGWAVKAAAYNGATWLIPSAGDSSMWLDDDEAGSGAPSCSDTALSPVVPGFAVGWLKWGVSFNWLGSAEVYEVGLKYHNGSVWQVAPLRNYTGDVNPMWDSVDVSAYASYDSLQVYFYYYDGASWMWYCAFDNVGLYLAATHDVGSVAFLGLGANTAPGPQDIIGVVQNFGAADETYDVHCVVDDNTFAVVLDTTIQVTTAAGTQDTITFGTVDFVDGRTYDLLMATLLGGDVNPLNDTLEQSTYCTAVFWEVLTPMPNTRSGAFAGYATINDTTYIHVFGGNPTASQTLHDVYNVTTATWAAGSAVPYPVNYGGHCSIDNKIYLIGSFIAASNPYMIIYDAESDVYTTVTLPSPINDPGIGVVDNNYIYILGGGSPMGWNPSTSAMLYDVAGDSFITGVTPMPGPIMAGVGGYLGNDTLIHAAGMTTGSVYLNTVYLGYINPANPASITWSTGPDKPGIGTYRLNGASFIPPAGPGRLYLAAGQGTGGGYLAATYVYVSGSGWATLPDKPTAHSNWGCTMVPRADADGEYVMYAAGGYTGSYLNIFHALHTGIDPFPGIAEQPGALPTAFGFRLLTSNPVADRVRFQFDLPVPGVVTFRVFDIAGRQILSNDYRDIAAGSHTMVWNRTDDHGRAVANGIYFYRLEAAGNVASGKLILVQ